MKRQTLALLIGVLALAAGIVLANLSPSNWHKQTQLEAQPDSSPAPAVGEVKLNDYKLSGPYTHENLTVFLVHGQNSAGGESFLPLEEALARKVIVVHETGDVNELAVENVSRQEEVFIQAGDIVKGGQQDRMLAVDLIVPARSGRIPIDAFCVEHGRWEQRGEEVAQSFGASADMATRELRVAAKSARSQQQVWDKVEQEQMKLSASTSANVRASASQSSLQLTLENGKVRESAEQYVKKLSAVIEGKPDVVGYAFAVNGRFSSADVYSSAELFRKLWPRLLKAAAIEAVAEMPAYDKSVTASLDSIKTSLGDMEKGLESETENTARTTMLKRESEEGVFFETRDLKRGGAWVHRNYLAK
jgi:hypothetical protein